MFWGGWNIASYAPHGFTCHLASALRQLFKQDHGPTV